MLPYLGHVIDDDCRAALFLYVHLWYEGCNTGGKRYLLVIPSSHKNIRWEL